VPNEVGARAGERYVVVFLVEPHSFSSNPCVETNYQTVVIDTTTIEPGGSLRIIFFADKLPDTGLSAVQFIKTHDALTVELRRCGNTRVTTG